MKKSVLVKVANSLILVCFLHYTPVATADSTGNPGDLIITGLTEVDRLHQEFSASLHNRLIKNNTFNFHKVKSIKQLKFLVQDLVKRNEPVAAANLIIYNIPYLQNNYDNLAIFDFISLLLEQNEITTANQLFTLLKNEGDRTLYSNAAFHFASYHYKRRNWNRVLALLSDTVNDLAPAENHQALLMLGIALQNKLNHRDAINSYNKIPPSSHVYIPARLNMAIANIRQGWWTDAHTIINDVLASNLPAKNEESINRLYLTLGYSFLYNEYYRNSRDAFRNVGLKSRHTNRALLGLALTAANQNDYIGALNAVRVLKNSNSHDLTLDESYFLMPYLYEKLQQHTTASAGYSEAISYYDNRISRINEIMDADRELYKYALLIDNKGRIQFDTMTLDLSEKFPEYIVNNYINLESYTAVIDKLGDKSIADKFDNLLNEYAMVLRSMVSNLLQKRVLYLNSYKDQSRYGLARLYDNTLAKNN